MATLPNIDFVGKDVTEIRAAIITTYEGIADRTLAPGDPVRLFLEAVASIIAQQRVLIDFSAKQNLLAYASGLYLDHIGALVGVTRLPAEAAIVTLRFTKSAPAGTPVTVPQGTRVTAGNDIQFSTIEPKTIAANETSATVRALCTVTGTAGNGYVVGQIDKFVDLVPFIASVSNTDVSQGGTGTENDDALRERIRVAPDRFSVAGSTGAYRYWALTASAAIADVSVVQSSPGHVDLYPLLTGGVLPDSAILTAVQAACSADNRRPLTDEVEAKSPEAVQYQISFQWWISRENLSQLAAVTAAVDAAVSDFVAWQRSKLGRDVNPSELIRRVMNAGAKRVVLTSPVYTAVSLSQVALLQGTATKDYAGDENE